MRSEGIVFKGTIYLGLMISDDRVNILEFNVRFGDPELSAVLPRLNDDLFPYLRGCAQGNLGEMKRPSWSKKNAVCVIMASKGYPGKYEKGKIIHGLDEASSMSNVMVFHAGTAKNQRETLTNGGRVLGVTGLGDDITGAICMAYQAVNKITWDGEYHRNDIGMKALKHVTTH
jgi:phosphoribosylamine--glycine ligase